MQNKEKKHIFLRLLSYIRPYIPQFILAFLLVIVITALELYRPQIIGDVIDSWQTNEANFDEILHAALIYLVVLIGLFICSIAQYYIMQTVGQKIIYTMRQEVFAHIQKLSMRFFDITPVGKIVTRVTNDVEALSDMYSNLLVRLVKNVFKIVGLAVVMLVIDVKMALLSFALLPVVTVLVFLFRSFSRKANRVVRNRLTDLNTFLSEHISGMKLIQIFGREEEKDRQFREKSGDYFKASWREMKIFAFFRPLIYFTYVLALVIVLGGGSSFVLDGTISLGTLYIFVQYIGNFFDPLQELAEQFGNLQAAMASAEKIFDVMDEEITVKEPKNPVRPSEMNGEIEFRHVWFAYENEDYILKDVSFVIKPGEKVAFVGATGAGKSTILNLVGRYYDINKGEILVDGIDIRQMDTKYLRSLIGQVQQDVFLFTGDIKSNIRLRNEGISDEEIKKAASHVNASRFIEAMPKQYDEEVTERGATLSAGQRQLISFARTLAYDPAILVLDEATANIDTETEQLITDALEKLMEGRTTIMVAHRLATIQHADTIMVMHHGRIRETGNHQELLAQNGIYKKLYELQLT